jgi:hypothetical protein
MVSLSVSYNLSDGFRMSKSSFPAADDRLSRTTAGALGETAYEHLPRTYYFALRIFVVCRSR